MLSDEPFSFAEQSIVEAPTCSMCPHSPDWKLFSKSIHFDIKDSRRGRLCEKNLAIRDHDVNPFHFEFRFRPYYLDYLNYPCGPRSSTTQRYDPNLVSNTLLSAAHLLLSLPTEKIPDTHFPSPPPLHFPCPMPGIVTYQKQNPICACTESPRPCGLKTISKRHGDACKPTCRRQGADFAHPLCCEFT